MSSDRWGSMFCVSRERDFAVMSISKGSSKRFRTLTGRAESFLREVEIESAPESVGLRAVPLLVVSLVCDVYVIPKPPWLTQDYADRVA